MFCMNPEVPLLPLLISFSVADITVPAVLGENIGPVITFSVARQESEMRLLASFTVVHLLLSVFPIKSSVS